MKKLVFAMAVAAVGTAMAVESSIVGYQQVVIPQGAWALYTPTFKGIATELKLGDVTVCNTHLGGVEFDDNKTEAKSGMCRGAVIVYKMDTDSGSLGSAWGYTSNGYVDRKTTKIETWGWGANRNETIGSNACLVVNNGWTNDVSFQVSGEVELVPVVQIPSGTWAIVGNNTPVDRKLGDFMLCNKDGVEFDDNKTEAKSGMCRGAVIVYKMNPATGSLGSAWGYTSNGYVDRKTTKIETWGWGAHRNEEIKAGEALVVNNGWADGPVQFRLKGPLEKDEE